MNSNRDHGIMFLAHNHLGNSENFAIHGRYFKVRHAKPFAKKLWSVHVTGFRLFLKFFVPLLRWSATGHLRARQEHARAEVTRAHTRRERARRENKRARTP
jgi:hypothetical protein